MRGKAKEQGLFVFQARTNRTKNIMRHRLQLWLPLVTSLLFANCNSAQHGSLPTYETIISRIGVPKGWERQEPNRPEVVSYKIKSVDPPYLALSVGHPHDSLFGAIHFRDHATPSDLIEALGTGSIIEMYRTSNQDPRAEITDTGVKVDTIGGMESLHIQALNVMHDPYHEVVIHGHHILVRNGWVYIAYAYQPENEALVLPKIAAVLERLDGKH